MISVVLESSNGTMLAKCGQEDNEAYLCGQKGHFRLLGDVDEYSHSVFSTADMRVLLVELLELRASLKAEFAKSHLDDIVELARRCQKEESATLTFTPFA